jgi:hypothetical protein
LEVAFKRPFIEEERLTTLTRILGLGDLIAVVGSPERSRTGGLCIRVRKW